MKNKKKTTTRKTQKNDVAQIKATLRNAFQKDYDLPDFVFTLKTEEEIEKFLEDLDTEKVELPPFEEVWARVKDKVKKTTN